MRTKQLKANVVAQLIEVQDNRCAICDEPPSENRGLAQDHDHDTGLPRGLLCTRCNMGLGFFRDKPELLERAAEYLRWMSTGRYPDICNECRDEGDHEYVAHSPFRVNPNDDGSWVNCWYECPQGHVWSCGYSPLAFAFCP